MCPGQQPISHPRGDVDALQRAGGWSWFPLQSLGDVHIYIPKHGANDMGGPIDGQEDTHRTSTDVEPQGAGNKVLRHPGPQAVILIFDREMVGLQSWSHGRPRMSLCTGVVMRKESLSWCLGPTVRVSGAVTFIIVPDPNG